MAIKPLVKIELNVEYIRKEYYSFVVIFCNGAVSS